MRSSSITPLQQQLLLLLQLLLLSTRVQCNSTSSSGSKSLCMRWLQQHRIRDTVCSHKAQKPAIIDLLLQEKQQQPLLLRQLPLLLRQCSWLLSMSCAF